MEIEIKHAGEHQTGSKDPRPYHAYVNGVMLRDKRGVGRRFKTKEAAEKAARN
jgi:hypothetical protein